MGITPLDVREVVKAKMYMKPNSSGRLKPTLCGRVRLVPKGFQQRDLYGRKIRKVKRESPTAHRWTQRLVDVVGLALGFVLCTLDVKEAFFKSMNIEDDEGRTSEPGSLWTRIYFGGEPHEQDQKFVLTANNKDAYEAYWQGRPAYRQLCKEVPGTQGAPSAFQRFLIRALQRYGGIQSMYDPCEILFPKSGHETIAIGQQEPIDQFWIEVIVTVHVDDLKIWQQSCSDWTGKFVSHLKQKYDMDCTSKQLKPGDSVEYCGELVTIGDNYEWLDVSQLPYVEKELDEVPLPAGRLSQGDQQATAEEVRLFRGAHGKSAWVTGRTMPTYAYEDHYAATAVTDLKVVDVIRLNRHIRELKCSFAQHGLRVPKLDLSGGLKVQCIGDAGRGEPGNTTWVKAVGGKYIGIMADSPTGTAGPIGIVVCKTGRLTRVTHGSFAAETVNIVEMNDLALLVSGMLEEMRYGVRPTWHDRVSRVLSGEQDLLRLPMTLDVSTDCDDLVKRLESIKLWSGREKSLIPQIAETRELIRQKRIRLPLHVDGDYNELDALTRRRDAKVKKTMSRLRSLVEHGYYEPVLKELASRSTNKKKKVVRR